jgi:hypothetical protein
MIHTIAERAALAEKSNHAENAEALRRAEAEPGGPALRDLCISATSA